MPRFCCEVTSETAVMGFVTESDPHPAPVLSQNYLPSPRETLCGFAVAVWTSDQCRGSIAVTPGGYLCEVGGDGITLASPPPESVSLQFDLYDIDPQRIPGFKTNPSLTFLDLVVECALQPYFSLLWQFQSVAPPR